MQVSEILYKHLSKVMHDTRLATLSALVGSLFHAKIFNLTGLGRALKSEAQERHAIRRVDRFLGNKLIQKDRLKIYKTICRLLIGNTKKPLIIVDWSPIPNKTESVLRAALATSGRALTLYEEIHPQKKYANPKLHLKFLKKLWSMLDDDVKPTIITDAGFSLSWFEAILSFGWNYVGRIRGNKLYRLRGATGWSAISSLHKDASGTPIFLGEIELCKDSKFYTKAYLYKSQRKGRKAKTHCGNLRRSKQSLKYAQGKKEPWILVSSLAETAKNVIKIYGLRMQIEEGFRDLKSTKYGFGFEHVNTNHIYRLNVFFLIAMLAAFIAWVMGWLAEKVNLQSQYQANSTRSKRVLSLFYLGCRIIVREKNKFKTLLIQSVIKNFPSFSEA